MRLEDALARTLVDCWHTWYAGFPVACAKFPTVDKRHWLWQMLLPMPLPYHTAVLIVLDETCVEVCKHFWASHGDTIELAVSAYVKATRKYVSIKLVNSITLA